MAEAIAEIEPLVIDPANVSGEPVLHGFFLNLADVWPAIERRRPRAS